MPNLLVADDSWLIRKLVSDVLAKAGHTVRTATNGLEALEDIRAHEPDCVFLDMLMPEMDGFGVLAALREENVSVPVIVLTADIQNSTREKCMRLGAQAILIKPPDEESIRERLSEVLAAAPKQKRTGR